MDETLGSLLPKKKKKKLNNVLNKILLLLFLEKVKSSKALEVGGPQVQGQPGLRVSFRIVWAMRLTKNFFLRHDLII